MKEVITRLCDTCNYYDVVCTGLWEGRKVNSWNTCAGHSEGEDHLLKVMTSKLLTQEQILEMRDLYRAGKADFNELAEQYGVEKHIAYTHVRDLTALKEYELEEASSLEEETKLVEDSFALYSMGD